MEAAHFSQLSWGHGTGLIEPEAAYVLISESFEEALRLNSLH